MTKRAPMSSVGALVGAIALFAAACAPAPATTPAPRPMSSADSAAIVSSPAAVAFLDTLQRRTFDWFWETTNPRNGLTPDRWPTKSFSSVAAVGFALTAYPIGVERGYVTREQAAERTLTTLRFFWGLPQGPQATGVAGDHGFFYHFLDMETGLRFETVELSTIDTTLLLGGVLACQQYFDGPSATEQEIRSLADSLYFRVDWTTMLRDPPLVAMGSRPEQGFEPADWHGYNEAMLLYVLALGSPTHPIAPEAWQAWTSTYQWRDFYGYAHLNFDPLFGHQYSHVWIDFRGIRDEYMRGRDIDYFQNSRRAVLSQRAYAVDNPNGWTAYDGDTWGLTASDGPRDTVLTANGRPRQFHTYWARGAAATAVNDDGTIAPTAAGGSIAFAPEVVIPTLMAMRKDYGDDLFQRYGFLDSFNPTFDFPRVTPQHGRVVEGKGWFDGDYLGIDQGPILTMLENHRTGLVWELMKRNPHVVRGLCRAGFGGGWLEGRCQ
ncbi:MAG TPA: glucoamylase family protein [Gemmatimonadaceae bacterium]